MTYYKVSEGLEEALRMVLGCWARKRLGASFSEVKPRKGHLGRCCWGPFSAFGLNPEGDLGIGWAIVTGWLS